MAIAPLNPANKPDMERKRIPMSTPVQRLEAPDIPGYHLHWFTGSSERIQRALDGGYEFVDERETKVNSVGIGNESTRSGNNDLGSRVSVISGQDIGKDGQPVRLVLMKIKQEWYDEDQKAVTARNEQVAASIRGGLIGAEHEKNNDARHRYVDPARTALPDLFNPNKKRRQA